MNHETYLELSIFLDAQKTAREVLKRSQRLQEKPENKDIRDETPQAI